ncbi:MULTISPECIES: helix-turn-helix domain-containing protein [unclassified Streptomyces]|uniref:winged helix-turn-helix transcriptional regulator n=1 Tax=unclassified Streptomyces TaxID=2593676 RepID=UPI001BFF78FB|nr:MULTISPECIES: helix-turn-helix domain-containing protein [unclassified Streptomyces]
MRWLETSAENCTVHRTLDLVGEKWSLLLLRDAMNGVRRFDDFRRHVGLSEAVLADRLRKLVAAGILETVAYREPGSRTRREYRLTRKGWDLWPAMIALKQWGDRYTADPEGPPLEVSHADCGDTVRAVVVCEEGHGPLTPREARTRPGPSARLLARADVRGDEDRPATDRGRPSSS